ncbi:MAG TPA: hypothetical protein VFI42_06650 [Thermomicrobiaceae bacterium]|nr:hypothetical protein [Thermomicrobiaceae bacterium]
MNEQGQEQEQEREALRQGVRLRALVGRGWERERGGQAAGERAVDLEPGCAYGVVTRQKVDDLISELRVIRGRLDSLFTLMVGAIALDLLLRLAGWQ